VKTYCPSYQLCLLYANYTWMGAVYVVSKNSPPTWYQLSLTVNDALVKFTNSGHDRMTPKDGFMTYERLVGARPVVAWMDMHQA